MNDCYTTSLTDKIKPVYEQLDELTQDELKRIISIARMVKNGECKRLIIERAYGKNNQLYIEASKPLKVVM